MGVEGRRVTAGRAKKAAPPYFSHEFIIQNHGDVSKLMLLINSLLFQIMSCVLMFVVVGFMFQATLPFSQMLVVPQYNITASQNETTPGAGN
jgi:translocating chain-associated membrane protein 1